LGRNENLISTQHIQALEKDYGLTITKGPSMIDGRIVMPDLARPKAGEVGKFERTGATPARVELTALIDAAMADKPTATAFAERLVLAGVEVRANFRQDTLNGFSFSFNGVPFKGSQLGKQYTGKALLERGLSYEQDRDYAHLKSLSAASRGLEQRDAAAAGLGNAQSISADRAVDPAAARNTESLRGVDRGADRPGSRALGTDPRSSAGRVESAGNDAVSVERQASPAEKGSAEARAESTPETNTERPGAPGPTMAPAREHGSQPADIGAGIATGVEVSSAGLITTGDKATDELLQAAHSGRIKAEREVLSRQKKQHAEDMANAKKRQS
ncbi:hypothetical protein ABN139_25710, partial [Klebsiella pneumoniae]